MGVIVALLHTITHITFLGRFWSLMLSVPEAVSVVSSVVGFCSFPQPYFCCKVSVITHLFLLMLKCLSNFNFFPILVFSCFLFRIESGFSFSLVVFSSSLFAFCCLISSAIALMVGFYVFLIHVAPWVLSIIFCISSFTFSFALSPC